MSSSDKKNTTIPPADNKSSQSGSSLYTFNRIALKAKYSFYSAVIFFLFANPETYLVLQRFFGKFLTFITPSGAPTVSGIFVNTGLFFLTMLGLMLLPSE
jgi:hypothetical protein